MPASPLLRFAAHHFRHGVTTKWQTEQFWNTTCGDISCGELLNQRREASQELLHFARRKQFCISKQRHRTLRAILKQGQGEASIVARKPLDKNGLLARQGISRAVSIHR